MAGETTFDYYYGDESNQFSFYRIPRQLITGDRFKRLSTDAKLLYGLLLDRMGLSAKNGWYDEQGRVYIYYTLDEIQEDLNCGHEKAVKLLSELDTGKGFGLIERVKQGQGRPTKIYVKRFTTRERPPQPATPQDVPRLPIFGSQDFGKAEVKSSEKQKSRLPVFGSADFRKSDTSYIKSNQTEFSQLNPSILPSGSPPGMGLMDRFECKSEVEETIGYTKTAITDLRKAANTSKTTAPVQEHTTPARDSDRPRQSVKIKLHQIKKEQAKKPVRTKARPTPQR